MLVCLIVEGQAIRERAFRIACPSISVSCLCNRSFSLKADISDNHGTEALENFEISTHCHKVKNECIIQFGFQERTVFQTIPMWPKLVDHYSF